MADPKKNAKLWRLYGHVRAAQRKGMGHQDLNADIRRVTGGKIAGIASLEKMLGIGDPKGRGEKLRESVANIADKATLGYGGEIRGAIKGAGAKMAGETSETPTKPSKRSSMRWPGERRRHLRWRLASGAQLATPCRACWPGQLLRRGRV